MRPLALAATGKPGPWPLVTASLLLALAAWLAATIAAVFAAPSLARVEVDAPGLLFPVHLIGVAFFPLAVTGAAWHLLPVMLRNGPRSPRRLWLAFGLLVGAVPLARGIAANSDRVVWVAAALLTAGLVVVLAEIGALVAGAPIGKTLVVSRVGIVLSAVHGLLAFSLGLLLFGAPVALPVSHERLVLMHLLLAVLGWLTLLILTVGRTLVPMLAAASVSPPRRLPSTELAYAFGLWLLLGGIAFARPLVVAAGAAVMFGAVIPAARLFGSSARGRIGFREGPLAHLLLGGVFLAEAAVIAAVWAAGAVQTHRAAVACGLLLLVGWAGGVIIGHIGKLLALSAWAAWPPGPRPKQAALYPRNLSQAEAGIFFVAVESLVASVLSGSVVAGRVGGLLLVVAAATALAGATCTLSRTLSARGSHDEREDNRARARAGSSTSS